MSGASYERGQWSIAGQMQDVNLRSVQGVTQDAWVSSTHEIDAGMDSWHREQMQGSTTGNDFTGFVQLSSVENYQHHN